MSGLLGSVYSFGDSLKRKVRGLLSDPLAQIQLNMNQAAGGFNDAMRSPATDYARAGGVMADDPSTQAAIRAEADRRIGALMNVMPGGLLGATVWHGSPHKFAKFDASKIGTGEGAQAYGHGLYLAESPKVAQDYAVTLSAKQGNVGGTLNGRPILDAYKALENQANRLPPSQSGAVYNKLDLMERLGFNELPDDVLKYAKEAYGANSPEVSWLMKEVLPKYQGAGSLYTVDLPDPMIARMLDWDKPLSQQAPEVQKALAKRRPDLYAPMADDYDAAELGQMIYRRLHEDAIRAGRALPAAEKERQMVDSLRKSGIPGIRYLDGGSRGAGSGTSNFVVFPGEEGLLTILERNGVPLR